MRLYLFFLIIISSFHFESVVYGEENFSDWLIKNGDYYRAISELRKEQWQNKNLSNWYEIEKRIILCYGKSGHYREGLNEWEYFNKSYANIVSNHISNWYLLKTKLYLNTREYNKIYSLQTTIEALNEGKEIIKMIKKREEILFSPLKDEKSPLLSGILSAFIPGAGQWYAGYPGDGIFSFIVVAAFAGGSYYLIQQGSSGVFITVPLTAFFYLGNIYGAVTTTYRDNLLKRYRKWEFYRDQNGFNEYKSFSKRGLGITLVKLKW